MIPLRDSAGGVGFAVRVHPRARRNAISGSVGNALKITVTAPAVDGRANEACLALLAEMFRVARSAVQIVSGVQNRNKLVRIAGVSADVVAERLQELLAAE